MVLQNFVMAFVNAYLNELLPTSTFMPEVSLPISYQPSTTTRSTDSFHATLQLQVFTTTQLTTTITIKATMLQAKTFKLWFNIPTIP